MRSRPWLPSSSASLRPNPVTAACNRRMLKTSATPRSRPSRRLRSTPSESGLSSCTSIVHRQRTPALPRAPLQWTPPSSSGTRPPRRGSPRYVASELPVVFQELNLRLISASRAAASLRRSSRSGRGRCGTLPDTLEQLAIRFIGLQRLPHRLRRVIQKRQFSLPAWIRARDR
jgi:hypothetical protein